MKPETSKNARELARLGLSAAGAAMELVSVCVPIPGLQLAAATTQKIFGLVDQMRLNKRRAQLLASSAREAVQTLDEAMSGVPLKVLESALGPTIQEFSQVLVSIEKRIEEFLHLTFLQRLVQYASIQDELGELDSKARDASERCKLKLNIDIKRQQVVDELARQKDTKAMLEKLQSNELARQEDVKALKEQLQALVRDPDRIADTIGLQGAHIDKASRDALQSLSLRIFSRPTLVEPEVRGFVEEATKVIKSRTNYHGPRTKPWVMKRGSFERREVIGAGGFSLVYKGRWKEGDMDVAIKEFINDEDIDDVMDEIWIWRRMEHPNLLPFIGGALIEPPYFAVSPYCAHGNVLQYISRHKDVDRLQLIIDITRGVDYLHSSHVVHGDLKARNVLINDQGTALVADFGLSRLHSLSSARSGVAGGPEGTMHWLAPELLKAEHVNPTVETDVWAFAMTLYELYTDGQIPFVDIADRPSLHRHLTAGHRPARLTNVALTGADLAWGLMQRCWLLSAKERPTFSWILTALTLLRPVFQTPDVEMLIQSPSQFRKMGWADSIFAQWPQGISALTNLLSANLENPSPDPRARTISDAQSEAILHILGLVGSMANNSSSWYPRTNSKNVFASFADAQVIQALDVALKYAPRSDVPFLACEVIRKIFSARNRDRFEAPPPPYRALSFEIQDSDCMTTLLQLLRSEPPISEAFARAISSAIRVLLALPLDTNAKRLCWSDAESALSHTSEGFSVAGIEVPLT